MEDVVVDRRSKAIEELVRGREFANRLRQIIINRDRDDDDDESAAAAAAATHHLVKKVVTSFANTLFLFNKYPTYQSLLVDPACLVISPAKSDEEEQDSQHSFSPTALKEDDTRGFYKRKRSIETRTKVSETQTDHDEHQWRKYGQKQIQNAKYSRNYYRCTHKNDQGCQATKHVQKVQEEPPLYRITYYGHHTCRNLQNPAQIILEDGYYSTSPPPDSSILLSFDNSFPNPTNPFLSSSFFPSTTSSSVVQAMECQEECNNNNNNKDHQVVAPSSSSTEPTLDNLPRHVTLSSTLESEDYWDVMMPGFIYDSFVDDDFPPFDGF